MEAVLDKTKELDKTYTATILAPFLGLAIGVTSYGEWWWTIGLSIFFPVLLFKAESRIGAFFVALFYQIGASRSLALGAARFYGNDIFFGVLIWAIGNALTASVYAAAWHRNPHVRLLTVPLAMVLTSLPPLGVLGWANPLTAAGIIFPGAGIVGIFYLLGLYASLAAGTKPITKIFVVLSIWCLLTAKVKNVNDLTPISTKFGRTEDMGTLDYSRQTQLISLASKAKSKATLFPENIVTGGWTEVSEKLWLKSLSKGKLVAVGATEFTYGQEKNKRNILAIIGDGKVQRYVQRQPIPFSMWIPFSENSYQAAWFDNPVVTINGKKTAFLICYEAFLVWPIVHSYLSGAEQIAASGNYWWTDGKDIPTIQQSIVRSWSRLFNLPFAVAVNT
jgi:hypothetical protein